MTGLRAKQKADRDHRILKAASHLFREEGYDRTKIETIAAEAEVAIGTVYNYYRNKGDLLVAIVSMEVNEVLAAGAKLIDHPPAEASAAVNALIGIYLDHSLVYLNKEMWRHAMAISTSQPESPFGRRYRDLDNRLAEQLCELIKRLQRSGRVKVGIDATAVGEMIFNNMNMMFTTFVKTEDMSLSALNDAIARQLRPLMDAIRS
ncbi:TetR/AcrR family transcriptional regulator [Pelagibius litoralis]|uniref:TetR/AcrR family transcriptional regulator n=1 Tax=Pelagibius litoralis TaxID=374515 RepID=A0A967C5R9_9PROT|nr:TetR/AcrR family transcriptional regulator [Pelagibius litoralis]NIA69060.1 TetR/AcrR family transcriptional regulator [Pelagibius litoralis]